MKIVSNKKGLALFILFFVFCLFSIILNASLNNYQGYVFKKVALKKWITSKKETFEIYFERKKVWSLLDIENYEDLSDMEKVIAVRNWVARYIPDAGDLLFDHNNKDFLSMSVSERMKLFLNHEIEGGFHCAGKARILSDIYNVLGFSTIKINYGFPNLPHSIQKNLSNVPTHYITAVLVGDSLIIQDPHSFFHYFDINNFDIPVYDILFKLLQGKYDLIINRTGLSENIYYNEIFSKAISSPECLKKKGKSTYYICKRLMAGGTNYRFRWFLKLFSVANNYMGLPDNPLYSLLHPIYISPSHDELKKLPEYQYLEELVQIVNNKTWSAKTAFEIGKKYFNL